MTIGVSADNRLMPCEMLLTKLLAQHLRSVNRQTVLNPISRVKADYVVMGFNVAPTAIFVVLEIGFHTGNGEIIFVAIQSSEATVFARDQPTVFIKNRLVQELAMLKKQIFLGRAIVGIFRA